MLYKKNTEKELPLNLFKAPTSEYRGTPFWSWNCKMTSQILEKQIEYLRDMGFGGFHMHSRAGMDNAYLSEEFMDLVKACVNKAKREKMLAWLYDEDRWPSGAAGGIVTKDPTHRARILYLAPANKILQKPGYNELSPNTSAIYDFSAELDMTNAIIKGAPYFIAAYDVILDSDGYLQSYKIINRKAKAKGVKWIAFCDTQRMSDWYNGYCYVDTLSKKSIRKFIEITHETYKSACGDEFDKAVPAIFTDEPQFTREKNLNYATDQTLCNLAWTPDFPKTFKKTYDSDIVSYIPELFWDLPNGKVSVARYRFHDHLCERFTEAFSGECGKWCEKNNIKLTGHMVSEPTLFSQTAAIGEAMRAYKYYGYPGIDMLCNDVELTTAKQTQSVVHQYGKEGMLSELYGVTNWDFDFRGHKFQGDWQAALGVTIRVPHLSWVSMKGDAKRDYPASINYQSPWYKEYTYIEDHFARLNTALTRGKPDVSIGVIHPIESYWLHWGPGQSTKDKREQLESNFLNMINWLLFAQLDFDYISEALLPDVCKEAKNPLAVGKMKYSTVIVPAMETMRRSTFKRLTDFKKAGGNLIFMGQCPKYLDAIESDEIQALYNESTVIPFERYALIDTLKDERKLEIRGADGGYTNNYIYQMRKDGNAKWLFICNAKDPAHADISARTALNIKIKGRYAPKLYDTLSGTVKDVSYKIVNGMTVLNISAFSHDSFLFKLEKTRVQELSLPVENLKTLKVTDYKGKIRYQREEPNVVVLDMAEFKWDNETNYQPLEEIRRLDEKVRKFAGILPKSGKQPWTLPPEEITHTETLRFTFKSEIAVSGAEFACEDADVAKIFFDGKPVSEKITGYFTDESIMKRPLPDFKAGTHVIEMTIPLGSRTYTENCFLLGEFNVRLEGCEKTLIQKTDTIGFGTVTTQGMPFYGGNITYFCDIDLPDDDLATFIHAHFYRGALMSVNIDGKDEGKIVFAPYTLRVDGLKKGKHTVKITLFGNRFNCFAGLHNAERNLKWVGPNMFVTKGDYFSYEYQLREMGILSSPIIEIKKKV